MRTHPCKRPDGSVASFEISNVIPWSMGPMRRVLASVAGVSDIERTNNGGDDRWTFRYLGRVCVVNEPWGDSSRYWVGPAESDAALDMSPVHDAFCAYRFLLGLRPSVKEGA